MAEPEIGRGWIIAIIALLALLVIGIAAYLGMSAPARTAPRRGAMILLDASHEMCSTCAIPPPSWV